MWKHIFSHLSLGLWSTLQSTCLTSLPWAPKQTCIHVTLLWCGLQICWGAFRCGWDTLYAIQCQCFLLLGFNTCFCISFFRSKDIEASSGNGDMAFQEVRIQQSVVEFILNHADQIFSSEQIQVKEGMTLLLLRRNVELKHFLSYQRKKTTFYISPGPVSKCGEKYATLPISGQCGPMKLMSLEEAQARSLSPDHPLHKERQRENSLPDTSTATLYHTVIDISDNK